MDTDLTGTPEAPGRSAVLSFLLPAATDLRPLERRLLGCGVSVVFATLLVGVLYQLFGPSGWETAMKEPLPTFSQLVAAAMVCMRTVSGRKPRMTWIPAAAAIAVYGLGTLAWTTWIVHEHNPPTLSVSLFMWEASYPLMLAAIIGAAGRRTQHAVSLKIWLDGLIAATAVAAICTAWVLPPIVHSARGAHETLIADLQFPMMDLVLGVAVVGVIGMRGWHVGRRWGFFIVAWAMLFAGDCIWAGGIAHGAKTGSSSDMLLYMGAFAAAALASWQPCSASQTPRNPHWSTLVLPTAFTLTAPAILIYDHFVRVPLAAFVLTMIAFVAATLRMALALRDMMTFGDMRRAALTDDLTELPNRRMFFTQLHQGIARARQNDGTVTAMMLDLDNFKQLNDTLGHDAGDDLLRMIGPRLERALGADDVVARLGGDEFAILLAPATPADSAPEAAEGVLRSLEEPLLVHGVSLRLKASVGIASFPQDAGTPEALIKCVDVAMYEAKRSRKGWERYAPERDQNTTERLELANALASALEQGEIVARFQPIVDTSSRQIVGAEALARWRKSDGALLGPGAFLESMEMAGLSRRFTRRMLCLGLEQVRNWRKAGHDVYVSVNATVADLLDESFPDDVEALLEAYSVSADALVIEVTEGSIVADPGRAGAILNRLHLLGVGIALDDFGTGYSSLTHLRELPVDAVKIDRSFVTRMCDEAADAAIVYATVGLAHQLNLRAVAEGVEDGRTWAALAELECERVQGYAYSRPVTAQEVLQLLAAPPATHLSENQPLRLA